jgi:hypothetical protein
VGRIGRRAAYEMKEESHAYGEAVGDLLENARLRTVSDSRINFEAADDGARDAGQSHQASRRAAARN